MGKIREKIANGIVGVVRRTFGPPTNIFRGENVSERREKIVSGIIGATAGAAAGAVAAGFVKIKQPTVPPPQQLAPNKEIIPAKSVAAGATNVPIKPSTAYKFAIFVVAGDGDPQILVKITEGTRSFQINGDEQGIGFIANENLAILADNRDTATARNAPSVEILSLNLV